MSERLQTLLEGAFPDAKGVEVVDRTGGGDHFHVTVVSPRFAGLSLVDQHRLSLRQHVGRELAGSGQRAVGGPGTQLESGSANELIRMGYLGIVPWVHQFAEVYRRPTQAGLEPLADVRFASDSLTAIRVPEGQSARAIIDDMVTNHAVMLQAGQGGTIQIMEMLQAIMEVRIIGL